MLSLYKALLQINYLFEENELFGAHLASEDKSLPRTNDENESDESRVSFLKKITRSSPRTGCSSLRQMDAEEEWKVMRWAMEKNTTFAQ